MPRGDQEKTRDKELWGLIPEAGYGKGAEIKQMLGIPRLNIKPRDSAREKRM